MPSRRRLAPVPVEHISRSILLLRGQRVILDADLAALYGVPTKALNQAVKRNAERFPEDLMLRLSRTETGALGRSQIVTGHQKHKLDELERKYQHHDDAIKAILSAIRELMNPPQPKRRPIGLTADLGEKS